TLSIPRTRPMDCARCVGGQPDQTHIANVCIFLDRGHCSRIVGHCIQTLSVILHKRPRAPISDGSKPMTTREVVVEPELEARRRSTIAAFEPSWTSSFHEGDVVPIPI